MKKIFIDITANRNKRLWIEYSFNNETFEVYDYIKLGGVLYLLKDRLLDLSQLSIFLYVEEAVLPYEEYDID